MNIQMIGIDFNIADIEKRELVSFTENEVIELLPKFKKNSNVLGCVMLATCNRTELYVHTKHKIDLLNLFANTLNINKEDYASNCILRYEHDSIKHLMEVSSGLQSQILGDDQILTQVKTALSNARKAKTTDNFLETMFRYCITAGKRVKTQTKFYNVSPSASSISVNMAQKFFGNLKGKKAIIIGNGEMGRLTAKLFVEKGCEVIITLRTYRHGQTIVPAGCKPYNYDERFSCMDGADIVCSATTSPHFTVTYDKVSKLKKIPKLFIDLAIPRDIETKIKDIKDTIIWNLDDLGNIKDENIYDRLKAIEIIEKEISNFCKWDLYRNSLPIINQMKDDIFKRITFDKKYRTLEEETNCNDELTKFTINKTVDLILNSMKNTVTPEKISECLEHIRKGF